MTALLVTQSAKVQMQLASVSMMTGCVMVIITVGITGTKNRHNVQVSHLTNLSVI